MKHLTEKEERVMHILWQLKKAFVKEVVAEYPAPKPPITTISSIMRKLESEGIIGYEAFGKTYRYYPILQKEDYGKQTFKKVINQYFSETPERLLSHFMEETDINPDEIQEILQKIKAKDD